ncbi:MAG: aminotransferase class IV [Chloroflexi bacterium]|nr:aminotransferase class IV [Chloroflexota bacterium]
MTKERIVYLNGEMVPESEAKVSIHDRGFKLGDAVFDNTRTFNGEVFKVREHLDRLYRSCKYLRLDPGMSKDRMAELTHQVVDANLPLLEEGGDYWVIQRVTRGVDPPSHNAADATGCTVIIQCDPIPFTQRATLYRDGIRVITPSIRRTPPSSLSPRAKTHNYVNMVLADLEVRAQDPDAWAVLLDINGNLAEGTGSNIFLVKDGAIYTPQDRYTLEGISRQTVLDLAHEIGIETVEGDIDLFDAYNADEVFITSTSLCICPVSKINGAPIADGNIPGPVTARLERAYSGFVGVDIFQQYLSRLQ